jgi:hypothetical protein
MNEATIRLHVEPLEEGGFVATSLDVQGLVAEARRAMRFGGRRRRVEKLLSRITQEI